MASLRRFWAPKSPSWLQLALQNRILGSPSRHLGDFLASWNANFDLFVIFWWFLKARTLSEPWKSVKNHWFSHIFHYFHKLLKMHRNPLKMLPKSPLEASKTAQNTPKRLPRRSMMGPKGAQETPKPFQDAPSSNQDAPKTSPRRPKCRQERPRSPQAAPQLKF